MALIVESIMIIIYFRSKKILVVYTIALEDPQVEDIISSLLTYLNKTHTRDIRLDNGPNNNIKATKIVLV